MQKTLVDAYAEVLGAMTTGHVKSVAKRRFEKAREAVGPSGLVSLDETLRRASRQYKPRQPKFGFLFRKVPGDVMLERCPWLAQVAIHAWDGQMRERAVRLLQHPAENPLDLAALLCRCNDHVPQVRELALKRWEEVCRLPRLDALVPVLPVLLDRVPHWQRGGAKALKLVRARNDFRYLVNAMFLSETAGRLAKRLRYCLRKSDFDGSLGMLATQANSTMVRAIATQAVLQGEIRHLLGYRWEWVDKTVSMRRRVPEWETRSITVPNDVRERVLRTECADKSAAVRKLAVDHLIAVGPEGYQSELASLRHDKSHAIQWRMDYFDRKWSEKDSECNDD